ncbi:hypothetical protein CBOM_03599 [Ceraceosorus bombacis]|uniref:Uncharacterized protein n=1 Tax=Ceraceosorus bombacis TaxID=401625 RepID=A0A0N7LA09_9BASI|nr:hypothetical protein CBOM_03599 [Ceraceosorus bombacis]
MLWRPKFACAPTVNNHEILNARCCKRDSPTTIHHSNFQFKGICYRHRAKAWIEERESVDADVYIFDARTNLKAKVLDRTSHRTDHSTLNLFGLERSLTKKVARKVSARHRNLLRLE